MVEVGAFFVGVGIFGFVTIVARPEIFFVEIDAFCNKGVTPVELAPGVDP